MPTKSYKQLYEETKRMLNKYQDEIVPKLREQSQAQSNPITEEELFALRAVAYGCNTNRKLQSAYGASFLDRETNKTVSFEKALVTVYNLIERLKGEDDESNT